MGTMATTSGHHPTYLANDAPPPVNKPWDAHHYPATGTFQGSTTTSPPYRARSVLPPSGWSTLYERPQLGDSGVPSPQGRREDTGGTVMTPAQRILASRGSG